MHDGRREDAKLQCDPNDSEVFPKNNPDAIHSSFLLPPTLFIPFSNPLCTSHTLRPSKREIYSPFLPPHPENMSPSEKWTPARKKEVKEQQKKCFFFSLTLILCLLQPVQVLLQHLPLLSEVLNADPAAFGKHNLLQKCCNLQTLYIKRRHQSLHLNLISI